MELWDYCFEKKEDPFFQWYFREYCLTHNLIMGGFSEATNRLVNMLHLNPYRILLRGREEVVPYICLLYTSRNGALPWDQGKTLACWKS